jgi:glycerophosphoryl diester phosphodiesterase
MRKVLVPVLLLSFLFFTCKKDPEIVRISNLSGGQIGVFGHGGMGIKSLLPINSKESLLAALKLGADGTEMDVQMSADSVLFLFHGAELSENTQCAGRIGEMPSKDIDCYYKSLKSEALKVITVRDFLEALSDTNCILTFELKTYDLTQKQFPVMARAISKLLREFNLLERSFVESTSPMLLLQLRQAEPKLRLFFYSEQIDTALVIADNCDFFGVTFDLNRVTAKQVEEAHQRNLRVTLFNQQTKSDNLRTLPLNPDFIQTDQLRHMLEVSGKK